MEQNTSKKPEIDLASLVIKNITKDVETEEFGTKELLLRHLDNELDIHLRHLSEFKEFGIFVSDEIPDNIEEIANKIGLKLKMKSKDNVILFSVDENKESIAKEKLTNFNNKLKEKIEKLHSFANIACDLVLQCIKAEMYEGSVSPNRAGKEIYSIEVPGPDIPNYAYEHIKDDISSYFSSYNLKMIHTQSGVWKFEVNKS